MFIIRIYKVETKLFESIRIRYVKKKKNIKLVMAIFLIMKALNMEVLYW